MVNVEDTYLLHADDLRRVEQLLPKGWVTGEVAHVKQVEVSPGEFETLKTLGLHGWRLQAQTSLKTHEIVFAQNSHNKDVIQNLKTFLHELGHANDFLSDNSLSSMQRINLLRDLGRRLISPDRYYSAYLENISIPGSREENNFVKAGEYFSELTVAYFLQPKSLATEDFLIVDGVVKASDPNYDPFASSIKMRNLFQEIQKHVDEQMRDKISEKLKGRY